MREARSVTVVGGGLAGCEAAYQLARRGHRVRLVEMKPHKRTPAQKSDRLAELVCSNSFRSANPENAIGLLHEELRRMGSLIMRAADQAKVPAGDALAVDREVFAAEITERIEGDEKIERIAEEATALPEGLAIIATGPLTTEPLARAIAEQTGNADGLYFYDAIAPIVSTESIDHSIAFAASRNDKGGADYLNLPLTKEEYLQFVREVRAGQKVAPHAFEEPKYFEGCLPIEVMAERGDEVLAHGPMKPVGLRDPRTGKQPHAVVQLRVEDRAGTAYNMVGFQTRLTWTEQKRIFRMLPGLQDAEFLRMGQIHRNTFIDAPRLLQADLSLRAEPRIWFAGQITGVEGYVESAACGLLVAHAICARLNLGTFVPPPATTALGALYRHVTGEAHPPDHRQLPFYCAVASFFPGQRRKPG